MSKAKELLEKVSASSTDHEYYTPIPPGYVKGKTKYIVVFGTVMSGLGKGIFASSLCKLLQYQGLTIAPIKFDGYLNYDAGTLNPFRHGEVFVLDDGTESDMDLGTYERFLDLNLDKDNYLTGGKILSMVLAQEREGKYLGRDVQFIPHVTGEIKRFMRTLAVKRNADVVMIEVGGTVGDIETSYFIEAMRQLGYEDGKENICYVALTYVLEPAFLGEQKSKAAQLGIRSLMGAGIQPDIIACRSCNPISEKIREKMSVYSNVPVERVIGSHNVTSTYEIPLLLKEAKLDLQVIDLLGLRDRIKEEKKAFQDWHAFVKRRLSPNKQITIGITGKYTGLRDSYASILKALEHAGAYYHCDVDVKWIETTEIEDGKINASDALKGVDGIIVPGGFGKRGVEGKIACIQHARENNLPYLGLCYGFQMALIEFARNVCGLTGANTTEVDPKTAHPVVKFLPEQLKIEGLGGNMRLGGHDIAITKGSFAEKMYGSTTARERFRHRFECNPDYIKQFEEHGLVFSGRAKNQPIMQILELPEHPFFVGTQAHPEFTSRPLTPNPFYREFIRVINERKGKK